MHELRVFGFRPNLTRMPPQARWYTDQATGNRHPYGTYEIVATDVALHHHQLTKHLPFHELGIWNPNFLFWTLETDRNTAQYIHAACAYGNDCDAMIFEFLRTFNGNPNHWNHQISQVCRIVSLCYHFEFAL
jgi:hypothetical protein